MTTAPGTPSPWPAGYPPATPPPAPPPRPRLTPRRLAALRQAAADPTGGFGPLTARDEDALEQLGYAAHTDDCGHTNTDPADTSRGPHRSHPHYFRITPTGRTAAQANPGPLTAGRTNPMPTTDTTMRTELPAGDLFGTIDTAQCTRAEITALHQRNIAALQQRIQRIQAAAPGTADEHTTRAQRRLRADLADERELLAAAQNGDYPRPLADS